MLQTLMLFTSTAFVALIVSLGLVLAVAHLNSERRRDKQTKGPIFHTFRISNIPRHMTKDQFRDILASLPDETSTAPGTATETNLFGWSFAPTAALSLSDRFCVATATFRVPPALDELEAALRYKIGIEASRLKVDPDFFGLTPLADPQQNVAVE